MNIFYSKNLKAISIFFKKNNLKNRVDFLLKKFMCVNLLLCYDLMQIFLDRTPYNDFIKKNFLSLIIFWREQNQL